MAADMIARMMAAAHSGDPNVQPDWAQTDTAADDYIRNKPALGTAAARNTVSTLDSSTDLAEAGAVKRVTDGLAETAALLDTVEAHGTVTTGQTIADTGITIDIPAGSGIWAVGGILEFSGSQPMEIQLRCTIGTGTSQYLMARATNANDDNLNFMFLSAVGLVRARADKDLHIKVFARSYIAAGNMVTVIARKLRKPA